MEEKMHVSVIIPTYNRAEKAIRIMRDLEPQMLDHFELIVVIDGSKDDTFKRIQSQTWNIKNLYVINQENKGRAGARNAGVAAAKGDVLIFIDDDIIVTDNFLLGHLEAHRDNDIVVGALESADIYGNREMLLFSNYLNTKWTANLHSKDRLPYISAANFSIKKDLFLKFNGFDGRLNDFEDLDLAYRLNVAGQEIYYSKIIVAKVPLNEKFIESIQRLKEYKKGREILANTDSLAGKALGETKDNIDTFKKIIFFFFSFSFWYKLIDLNFFTFLPQKVRFKLYDYIMTANMIY
jgi:glycosyltransferase involved in cell wall biosynthesis